MKLVLLRISLLSSLDCWRTSSLHERKRADSFKIFIGGVSLQEYGASQHPIRDSSERAGGGAAPPFLGVQGKSSVKLLSGL